MPAGTAPPVRQTVASDDRVSRAVRQPVGRPCPLPPAARACVERPPGRRRRRGGADRPRSRGGQLRAGEGELARRGSGHDCVGVTVAVRVDRHGAGPGATVLAASARVDGVGRVRRVGARVGLGCGLDRDRHREGDRLATGQRHTTRGCSAVSAAADRARRGSTCHPGVGGRGTGDRERQRRRALLVRLVHDGRVDRGAGELLVPGTDRHRARCGGSSLEKTSDDRRTVTSSPGWKPPSGVGETVTRRPRWSFGGVTTGFAAK